MNTDSLTISARGLTLLEIAVLKMELKKSGLQWGVENEKIRKVGSYDVETKSGCYC